MQRVAISQSRTCPPKIAPPPSLRSRRRYADSGDVVYTGKDLKARKRASSRAGRPDITFQTKDPARFGKLTTANCRSRWESSSITSYVSAPIIQGLIYDNGQITGQFTQEQTITLANELNAGALPVR